MEVTLEICGMDLAAGERHGLENSLVAKCGLLIWLSCRTTSVLRFPFSDVTVFFSHKINELQRPKPQPCGQRCILANRLFPKCNPRIRAAPP